MKSEIKMQKEKERFIKKVVNEAQRNLERNLDETGNSSIIIPYRNKSFLKIQEYMEEINEEARKRRIPFKAFEVEELPREIKYEYI